jgi:hypothetical protein
VETGFPKRSCADESMIRKTPAPGLDPGVETGFPTLQRQSGAIGAADRGKMTSSGSLAAAVPDWP